MPGKITDLTSLPTANRATNLLEVVDVGGNASYKVTPNFLLGLSGNPVGDTDSQTLTNKTLTGPTISGPVLSGTVTGTYTLGGTPTFPAAVVTLTGSQTLTNKVLTSPTISSPTITNASITADAITGFTNANNGTIYGIPITSSALGGTAITNNTIDASKIKWSSTGANAGIWWEELGRTTLGVAGDTLAVTSFATRKYLHLLIDIQASTALAINIRFNNDSGANYALRFVNPSTLTGTALSNTSFNNFANATSSSTPLLIVADLVNRADAPKFGKFSTVGGSTAAATAPDFLEIYGKWTNTTDQITRVDVLNTGAGDFAIGSELVVLGHN